MVAQTAVPDEITPPAPQPREFVRPGVVVGVVAWLVGYLLALGIGVGLSAAGALDATGTDSTLQVGAWLFYSAHLAVAALVGVPVPANVVLDGGGLLYVLAAVPVFVVAAAGALVVARVGVPGAPDALKGGAAVALGYVVPSAVGVLAVDGSAVVAGTTYPLVPGVAVGVVLVGVVYPAVVGALGGALSVL